MPLGNENNAILRTEALPFCGSNKLEFICEVKNERESLHTRAATTTLVQHKASIKLALLIGNWAYKNMPALEKVRADVKVLHDQLDLMEFKVVALCNLSRNELKNAVKRFSQLLLPRFLFYFIIFFPLCYNN